MISNFFTAPFLYAVIPAGSRQTKAPGEETAGSRLYKI